MSNKRWSRERLKIATIEKQRRKLIELLFSDSDLVEGSYRESFMRCGKEGCRCNETPSHPVARISRWEEGKLKNKVVRIGDREWVEKWAANYREHKRAISELAKLNTKEGAILKSIINRKKKRYE